MTMALYSENGFITDVASIGGWWDLITEVDKMKKDGPLSDFLDTGKTTKPEDVIKEIDELLPDIFDSTIRSILEGLKKGLQKVKEVAIISG